MTRDDIEKAFRAGFKAGFGISRGGFNAEYQYDHCAPGDLGGLPEDIDPVLVGEDRAWEEFKKSLE